MGRARNTHPLSALLLTSVVPVACLLFPGRADDGTARDVEELE